MKEPGEWNIALDDWLNARGWELCIFGREYCPEGYYLATGLSSRGVMHMVVMKNGILAHDPHPSQEGLKKTKRVYLFLPLDPAKFELKG